MRKKVILSLLVVFFFLIIGIKSIPNHKQVVSTPKALDKALVNPYTGFAPEAEGGPYHFSHSLVYANITWKELEPQKGKYNFSGIEKKYKLDYWSRKNVKVILRVILDYPTSTPHRDIPDWLYKEMKGKGTEYAVNWGKGFSPDYADPLLISYHKTLIKKLGDRYNSDDHIAFIELGSIGHWGEWHTIQDNTMNIPFPKLKITNQYVMHYVQYFPDKFLMMRRPYPLAAKYHMGLFNDMFGNEEQTMKSFSNWVNNGYVLWLTGEKHPPMKDYWKKAPTGGEFDPGKSWNLLFSSPQFSKVINQAKETHVSWLGPNIPVGKLPERESQANLERFLQSIGYQLRVVKETHPDEGMTGSVLPISMEWKNDGTAPFYFRWPLEISLIDKSGIAVFKQKTKIDIRNWTPGEHGVHEKIMIPESIDEGQYKVGVAILNPATEKPEIKLKMVGIQEDGRYLLGRVNIKRSSH